MSDDGAQVSRLIRCSEMHWTKPQVVAQIKFVEWTAENRLRHAAFLGLRPDKSAKEVRREP
jgi:bifunctional non-homologous end joining protein LigD